MMIDKNNRIFIVTKGSKPLAIVLHGDIETAKTVTVDLNRNPLKILRPILTGGELLFPV